MNDRRTHTIMIAALIFLVASLGALIWGINDAVGIDPVAKYNCDIAEISPDYTPAMKQECRRLRSQRQ
jgi:hypothetical protein